MKFRAHDTFFIRKGWLSKGMRCVSNKPDVFIAHDENPMDVLGIGANMVKALRYWLQAVGLTKEPNSGRRVQSFTDLGELIYQHDTYIEELGTLCLLQYCLASQEDEATAWYFFFNEFSMSEFSREDPIAVNTMKIQAIEGGDTVSGIRMEHDVASMENEDRESFYPADGVFVALGTAGSTEIARQMGAELTDKGNVRVNSEMETTIPGLFAAGDCTGGLLQVSKAVYEGSMAGINAGKYVRQRKKAAD